MPVHKAGLCRWASQQLDPLIYADTQQHDAEPIKISCLEKAAVERVFGKWPSPTPGALVGGGKTLLSSYSRKVCLLSTKIKIRIPDSMLAMTINTGCCCVSSTASHPSILSLSLSTFRTLRTRLNLSLQLYLQTSEHWLSLWCSYFWSCAFLSPPQRKSQHLCLGRLHLNIHQTYDNL